MHLFRWSFWICSFGLGFLFVQGAFAAPSAEAPARNSAFVLLDSGQDSVRLLYRNPANQRYVRVDSAAYIGIPAGASYEVDYISWEQRPYGASEDSPPSVRSESLSSEEFTKIHSALGSAVKAQTFQFQEIDVLKIEINSFSKVSASNDASVTLMELEFEVSWREGDAPRAERTSDLDAGFNRMFRNLCVNGEQISSLRRKRILPEKEKDQGFSPSIVGYKEDGALINLAKASVAHRADAVLVRVRETGMTAVRAQDLLIQGVLPDRVVLDQVRIWHRGVEQPAAIDEKGDGVFGEEDAILFYGRESDSEYTQDSHYYLTWFEMETPPLRIETLAMEFGEGGADAFLFNRRYDEDRMLVEEKSNLNYGWYYLEMDERSKTLDLDLPDLAAEGQVQITLNAFNKSRINKGFTVSVNDATAHFSSKDRINVASTYKFTASATEFIKASTFSITLDEDPEPYFPLKEGLSEKVENVPHLFFDSIEILYPRRAMFEENGLAIERSHQNMDASSLIVQATGEARPFSAWIVDATGQVIRWTADAAEGQASVAWPRGDWQVMEFIHDADVPGPYTVDRDYMSSLHRRDQGYDYIIVAPRFMAMTAKELANKRSDEGFEVLLVDVQDIYDEFNYGYPDCQAIKNFFRYAQSEWTGLSPEFVLLIGDCTWDHRDRLGTGAKDFLPTYAPLNDPMEDASDEWYAYLWGGMNDYFSDLIMGRISVQNVDDLKKYIDKIGVYEKAAVGPWRARSVYITDDDDGTFERFAISNSQKSLPDNYYPHFIHQGDYPLVTNPYLYHRFMDSTEPGSEKYRNKKYCPLCAKAIIDEFDHGSVIMQYIGHGGNQLWSDERIFYGTDKLTSNLLELQPNTRFPFVVSWSCLTGYLNFNIQPFTICLSEELIRYPDRGAIGVWGPSGGGTTNKHMSLSKYMLRNFTLDGLDRLGEATTMTKIEFMQEETSPSLVHQYILFGDPAVRLSLPEENVPVAVNPPYFVTESDQKIEIDAQLAELKEGNAIVSMTLGGEHVYESKPFEFSGGRILHSFSTELEAVSESTATVRFYAWSEKENRDAWGGAAIPQKTIQMELGGESVVWDEKEASVQFILTNPSPFALENVACELRMGDQVEAVSAPEIAANATAAVQWTGVAPESAACAYAFVLEDQEQGIQPTPEMNPLIIPLRTLDNPITPLLGVVSYSGKELVEDQLVRMQIQVRNFAKEGESSSSFSLAGPGAATDVKDVTLAAGRERRLDFSINLPQAGEYEYLLSKRSGDAIETASIALTVYGKPDLALAEGDFSFEPARPVIGSTVRLKTTVFNVGEGPALNIVVKAFDGDPSLKRELRPYNSYRSSSIDRLEPGEMKEIELVWDPEGYEGLGTHEIHFVVDPQNRIEELSEDNNRSSAGLTLHDLPDLAVDRWTDHGFRTELKNKIALWGQPLDLIGKISNIGDSDADYVRFTFVHNRKDITYFFDRIPKSFREETSIEVPLYASKNTLRIVADRYDLIAEKNEKDNSVDFGNNISEEARMDFDIMMPVAPVVAGRRIYRVTNEDTFSAGKGEFLVFDEKQNELLLLPNLDDIRYRIVPAFVQDEKSFSLAHPNLIWKWNKIFNCFYSPLKKDTPLRLSLPAPNGIYDVSMHIFSPAYAQGKTERIRIKTPQDLDPQLIEHGEVESGDYMRLISRAYRIRDDQLLIELRPVIGGESTVIADIQFTRADNEQPISGGYLSPYLPAPGSGGGQAVMRWEAEIPEGTDLQFKARWVMSQKDGSFRFFPWARIVDGKEGRLQLPGRGDYFQYYVDFIRYANGAETPKLRSISISIPCIES
ncbi:MAG: hypothetical protein JXR73_08720 [Candidatus Omnitrophica bacterium]|nr:hypothetical protein [Candidatus Omnitrophota bacterium]